jgi:histidinol-phosphate phosphatase family protein
VTTVPESLLLLDRDGVLLRHHEPYALKPDHVVVIDGALNAVAALAARGAAVAVVTNQSPIGRGLVDRSFVEDTNRLLQQALRRRGVEARFYVCPHVPGGGCACRKPQPGLLLRAAEDLGMRTTDAWMIGDQDSDMLAGVAAGCVERIHIISGRQPQPSRHATQWAQSLADLATGLGVGLVLAEEDPSRPQ